MKAAAPLGMAVALTACRIAGFGSEFSFTCEDPATGQTCEDLNRERPADDPCMRWTCVVDRCELQRLDSDGDGAFDPGCELAGQEADCAPEEPRAKPGEREVCDLIDNDCDGWTDEDVLTLLDQQRYSLSETGTLAISYAHQRNSDGHRLYAFFVPDQGAEAGDAQALALRLASNGSLSRIARGMVSPVLVSNGSASAFSQLPLARSNAVTTSRNGLASLHLIEPTSGLDAQWRVVMGSNQDVATDPLTFRYEDGGPSISESHYEFGFTRDTAYVPAELRIAEADGRLLSAFVQTACDVGCALPNGTLALHSGYLPPEAADLVMSHAPAVIVSNDGTPVTVAESSSPALLGIDSFGWLLAYVDSQAQRVAIRHIRWDEDAQELIPAPAPLYLATESDSSIAGLTLARGAASGATLPIALAYSYGPSSASQVILELLALDVTAGTLTHQHSYQPEATAATARTQAAAAWHSAYGEWLFGWADQDDSDGDQLTIVRLSEQLEPIGTDFLRPYESAPASAGAFSKGVLIAPTPRQFVVLAHAQTGAVSDLLASSLGCR